MSDEEELEAWRKSVRDAECRGDGVHSTDLRFWHDWRLWRRESIYDDSEVHSMEDFISQRKIVGVAEQWYCTRCRRFEERTVEKEG